MAKVDKIRRQVNRSLKREESSWGKIRARATERFARDLWKNYQSYPVVAVESYRKHPYTSRQWFYGHPEHPLVKVCELAFSLHHYWITPGECAFDVAVQVCKDTEAICLEESVDFYGACEIFLARLVARRLKGKPMMEFGRYENFRFVGSRLWLIGGSDPSHRVVWQGPAA